MSLKIMLIELLILKRVLFDFDWVLFKECVVWECVGCYCWLVLFVLFGWERFLVWMFFFDFCGFFCIVGESVCSWVSRMWVVVLLLVSGFICFLWIGCFEEFCFVWSWVFDFEVSFWCVLWCWWLYEWCFLFVFWGVLYELGCFFSLDWEVVFLNRFFIFWWWWY